MIRLDASVPALPGLPIHRTGVAEVERATGIPRATLRIWERRYGFPNPDRDARGERFYSDAQIAKLRLIGALTARGHRPGRLIDLPVDALQDLANDPGSGAGRLGSEPLVQLVHRLDASALKAWLLQQLAAHGLERFCLEVLPSSNDLVGEAWACGEVQVHQEHLYTECVQQVLRTAMAALPPPDPSDRPRVLLATLPREQHGLGLLAVEALLALERCATLPLGLNLPATQIAAAAAAWKPDVVALSFSQAYGARDLWPGLLELRTQLASSVDVWVGGRCAALARPEVAALPGVRHLPDAAGVKPALAALRDRAA